MDRRAVARQLPLRLTTGAFVLNSGLTKHEADERTAEQLHGFASSAYPVVAQQDPQRFVRMLSAAEIALGTTLLLPVIPPAVAGAGLTAFAAGLIGLYLRAPGVRQEGSLRPTEAGTALAKDVWLLGVGTALVVDGLQGWCRKASR